MKEWQLKKEKQFVMPDAVFYQTLWAVRDLDRMENRLEELSDDPSKDVSRSYYVFNGDDVHHNDSPTERDAVEKVLLESRVSAIRNALNVVPKEYRETILLNVSNQVQYRDRSALWRLWRQRFLYYVAKNLSLM